MAIHFRDRQTAGSLLGLALEKYRQAPDVVIYALPRGGVVLGHDIARRWCVPLDLVIARKIGHPQNPEFAIGAVTEHGDVLLSPIGDQYRDEEWLLSAIADEYNEAKRRRQRYMEGRASLPATGKIAVIVDDGVATGLTLRAALKDVRAQSPKRLVVAVPVMPRDVFSMLEHEADDVVVLDPGHDYLGAVGAYYDDFPQVSDEQVLTLLDPDCYTVGGV